MKVLVQMNGVMKTVTMCLLSALKTCVFVRRMEWHFEAKMKTL